MEGPKIYESSLKRRVYCSNFQTPSVGALNGCCVNVLTTPAHDVSNVDTGLIIFLLASKMLMVLSPSYFCRECDVLKAVFVSNGASNRPRKAW